MNPWPIVTLLLVGLAIDVLLAWLIWLHLTGRH